MLFNEPKLLKSTFRRVLRSARSRFSALQRAEIAEILQQEYAGYAEEESFSALQRAEIAEIGAGPRRTRAVGGFSALQRAEIAEIVLERRI